LLPTSFTGLSTDLGGFRYYYQDILLILSLFIIADIVYSRHDFAKKSLIILFWICVSLTLLGLLILFVEPLSILVESLQLKGIFSSRAMATGWWGVKKSENVFRSGILYSVPPIGIMILLSDSINLKKMIKLILMILLLIGLVFSGTRSFFFSIIIVMIFIFIYKHNIKTSLAIVSILVLIGLFAQYEPFMNQFDRFFIVRHRTYQEAPEYRTPLYSIYWETFKKYPVIGIGFGKTEVTSRNDPESLEYYISSNLRIGGHSFILGTLYTKGLLGLMPILWLYFRNVQIVRQQIGSNGNESDKAIVLFCGLFLIYSIIPLFFGGVETYSFLFVVSGYLAGIHMRNTEQKK
jgi:hypothetical protein